MATENVPEEVEEGNETTKKTKSPFTDAVYNELSRINGKINQMSRKSIIYKLKQLKLNADGSSDVLKKRLKNHYKNEKLTQANIIAASKLLPYYVVVDFEATCQEVNASNFPHEIIEFPAVLVQTENLEIVDHFQAYCKPEIHPMLSDFCVELTGITQEQVDNAEPFSKVLESFECWLKKHKLGSKYKFGVVTDGPWDMGRFLQGQCLISNIPYPRYCKMWINIRKIFSNFYKCKRYCLKLMLEHLEIGFEGRPHCGLDDAQNIARILLRLLSDGASIQPNERILKEQKQHNFSGHGSSSFQEEKFVTSIQSHEPMKDFRKVHRERCIRERKLAALNEADSGDSSEEIQEKNTENKSASS